MLTGYFISLVCSPLPSPHRSRCLPKISGKPPGYLRVTSREYLSAHRISRSGHDDMSGSLSHHGTVHTQTASIGCTLLWVAEECHCPLCCTFPPLLLRCSCFFAQYRTPYVRCCGLVARSRLSAGVYVSITFMPAFRNDSSNYEIPFLVNLVS
ncbi:hypothetical protein BJV78DRAFT_380127 [Lactifluus subvellereus]|nr:hypothetical protein BJV78DRAFT_380127 [Lactifluus subvellereus]